MEDLIREYAAIDRAAEDVLSDKHQVKLQFQERNIYGIPKALFHKEEIIYDFFFFASTDPR